MDIKVGIPRAMLFHDYYPMWESFFGYLGVQIVVSPKTNNDILNAGILNSVDESCLPVKLYHGHVDYLKDKVDYIFIPKFISIHKKEYCCPKLLGLPEMITHSIKDLPEIISPIVDINKDKNMKAAAFATGSILGKSKSLTAKAYKHSLLSLRELEVWQAERDIHEKGKSNLLVLGHSYNVFDEFLNMNLLQKLSKQNINLFLSDDVYEKEIRYFSSQIKKRMFWTHGRKIIGSAFSLIENKSIDGIIYLSSFGCGLDSVLVHLVSKSAIEDKIPILVMTLDEQTGEAGFNTRLEAFFDMIEWRVKDENYISAFR